MTINNDNDRLLRIQQVKAITGISKTTIYKLIGQGKFPKAIHVSGSRISSWSSSELDEWITEQKASRNLLAFDGIDDTEDNPTPTPRNRKPRVDKPVKA